MHTTQMNTIPFRLSLYQIYTFWFTFRYTVLQCLNITTRFIPSQAWASIWFETWGTEAQNGQKVADLKNNHLWIDAHACNLAITEIG